MGIAKCTLVILALPGMWAFAQDHPDFRKGPVITEFGKIANVKPDVAVPRETKFKVRFDVARQATPGKINATMESAARFINMHVQAGVPRENIHLALVFHGGASWDITKNELYRARNKDQSNASASAAAILLKNNVEIYICGQSATYHKITRSNLLPGVKIALSAMTAHAMLDQKGYSLNPF